MARHLLWRLGRGGTSSMSGKLCSKKLTQPGQQEARMGSRTLGHPPDGQDAVAARAPSIMGVGTEIGVEHIVESQFAQCRNHLAGDERAGPAEGSPRQHVAAGAVCTTTVLQDHSVHE